jgi:MFS family permease
MIWAGLASVLTLAGMAASVAWNTGASLVIYTVCLMLMAPLIDLWTLARQALVAETMEPAKMARAMTALGGTQRVGNLIGPLAGAGLMLLAPVWSVFAFSAVMAAAAVVVICLPAGRALDDRAARNAGSSDHDGGDGPGEHRRTLALRELDVRWGPVLLSGISIITLTVARAGQPIIVQLWGVHIDLHNSAISALVAVGAAVELVVMFLGGYLKDRWGRVAILTVCLSVFGAGFLVMVASPTAGVMLAAVLIMSLGNGLGAGVNLTIGADLSPAQGRARFLGVWAMFNNAGKLGGPALTSLIIAISTLRLGIVVTGAIALVGAVWTLCFGPRMHLPGRMGRRR